jgi:hypothetical protein
MADERGPARRNAARNAALSRSSALTGFLAPGRSEKARQGR